MREEAEDLSLVRSITYRHGVSKAAHDSIGLADEPDVGWSNDASYRMLPPNSPVLCCGSQERWLEDVRVSRLPRDCMSIAYLGLVGDDAGPNS
jgi:hypothetical protein